MADPRAKKHEIFNAAAELASAAERAAKLWDDVRDLVTRTAEE